jgi:RimJ/RimL family protein N-acetyltransferase
MKLIPKTITIDLFEDFFKLKSDPNDVAWSGYKQAPDKSKFKEWVEDKIRNENFYLYLFYDENNVCIGYIAFCSIGDKIIEHRSLGVLSKHTGQGLATEMTGFLIDFARKNNYTRIYGYVSERNIASIKQYLKNSFIKTSDFEIRELPLLGGSHKFYKYIKDVI